MVQLILGGAAVRGADLACLAGPVMGAGVDDQHAWWAQRVDQPRFTQRAKRRPFAIRAHDRAAPECRIVHIVVFGRDIEIAADDEIRRILAHDAVS